MAALHCFGDDWSKAGSPRHRRDYRQPVAGGGEAFDPGSRITRLWPSGEDFRRAWPAALRGTTLGSLLGIRRRRHVELLFAAYALEKKVSRTPSEFGQGAVEGVAGSEAANNAGAQTSFIPMLILGLLGNAVMALMIGALTIHGIQPGPQVMTERPGMCGAWSSACGSAS